MFIIYQPKYVAIICDAPFGIDPNPAMECVWFRQLTILCLTITIIILYISYIDRYNIYFTKNHSINFY